MKRVNSTPSRRFPGHDAWFVATSVLLSVFFLVGACNDSQSEDPTEHQQAGSGEHVAKVAYPGVALLVRQPGDSEFERRDDLDFLDEGTTVRSIMDWVVLNVVQAVQVQLSPFSEVLLLGETDEQGRKMLLLGVQAGNVRVNSMSYDHPVRVETPVGSIDGLRAHLNAEVTQDEDGGYQLKVEALSRGLVLTTPYGSVPLPLASRGVATETTAPTVLPSSATPR